jgi:hypothetical protein
MAKKNILNDRPDKSNPFGYGFGAVAMMQSVHHSHLIKIKQFISKCN